MAARSAADPGQAGPPERAGPAGEQRPDVGQHEARVGERVGEAHVLRLAAQPVAVVEDDRPGVHQVDHRPAVHRHRLAGPVDVLRRLGRPQLQRLLQRHAVRHVAVERVVGRGLVGHHVRDPATGHQLGQHVGTVRDHGHRQRPAVPLGRLDPGDAVVQGVGDLVQVAVLEPALRPPRVHLDAQGGAAVAGHGQRLRAAHAAEATGEGDRARQGAAEVLVGDLGEGRVGPLQDPLGADVDPRAGRHLAVHHQALVLELAEVLGGGPARHQQRVGDQHPRRALVGAHHAHRLARLHQQGVVRRHRAQRVDDRVEGLPGPGGPAVAAVDHQVVRPLGDLRVQVVLQHPQRGLGSPGPAGHLGAARGADRSGSSHGRSH